jgi:hypothetical protein
VVDGDVSTGSIRNRIQHHLNKGATMKRGQANRDKMKRQIGDFLRDLHYKNVVEVGSNKEEEERRKKRYDIIVRRKFKKGEMLSVGDKEVRIKLIRRNGIIILENWDEIDPIEWDKQL